MIRYNLPIILIFILTINAISEKYEAENATITSQAAEIECEGCSGGKAVDMKDGNLTFVIEIPQEGYYKIDFISSSPAGDNKQQKIRIDSSITGVVDFGLTFTGFKIINAVKRFKFTKGMHTVDIIKYWGYVLIDYIEILPVDTSEVIEFKIGNLTNPNASSETKKLYDYLKINFGRKVISGMQIASARGAIDEINNFESQTGYKPALIGLDFLHDVGYGTEWHTQYADSVQVYKDAKMWYENYNGIVAICWHWRDPLKKNEAFYSMSANTDQAKTSFDIKKVFDETSEEYKAMISDMDVIAKHLKKMQEDGIPILWRPLHEASGGWFWWGAGGPEACKRLWKIMYDRYTNFHKINNLIWVWTSDTRESAKEWYPGDDYVDIVGTDIYTDPPEHSSQILEFEKLKDITEGKKILALSECGAIPSAQNMKKDGSFWSWFMPWYHDYTLGYHNQVSTWKELFNSEIVIKVKDLPNWKNYQIQSSVLTYLPSISKNIKISYNTELLRLEIPDDYTDVYLYSLSGKLKEKISSFSYSTNGNRTFNIYTIDLKNRPYLVTCKSNKKGVPLISSTIILTNFISEK